MTVSQSYARRSGRIGGGLGVRVAAAISRRSTPLPFAALATAVQLLGMFGAQREWQGMWLTTTDAICWPMLFVAAITAGGACLEAVSMSRRGAAVAAAASRSGWRLEAIAVVPWLVICVATTVVGCVAGIIVTWPVAHQGPGFLDLASIGTATTLPMIGVFVGHAAGRLVHSWWTPPVAAFAAIIIGTGVNFFDRRFFFPLAPSPDYVVNPGVLLHALLLTVAVGVFAVGGVAAIRSVWRKPWVAPASWAGACGVIAAVALVVGLDAPAYRQLPPSSQPVCTDGKPSMCVHPASRKYLTELNRVSAQLNALPPGLFHIRPAYYSLDVSDGGVTPQWERFGYVGNDWYLATTLAELVLSDTLFNYGTCGRIPESQEDQDAYWDTSLELSEWLSLRVLGTMRPPGAHTTADGELDLAGVESTLAKPQDIQARWVKERIGAMENLCQHKGDGTS